VSKLLATILKNLNPFLTLLISFLHPRAWIFLSSAKEYKADKDEAYKLLPAATQGAGAAKARKRLTRDWTRD
jgi:hypothetical protein